MVFQDTDVSLKFFPWQLAIAPFIALVPLSPHFLHEQPLELSLRNQSLSNQSLSTQPTGQYFYLIHTANPADTNDPPGYVLLRKSGESVIGVDGRRSQPLCFRGFLEGDRILNATRVFPPYDPASRWSVQAELMDLSSYEPTEQEPDEQQSEVLQTCVDFFAR